MSHQARHGLIGYSHSNDRLWLVDTGDFIAGITEYNHELTGFDPRLREIDSDIFHYGGNAYYILGQYADGKGWRVKAVEDR